MMLLKKIKNKLLKNFRLCLQLKKREKEKKNFESFSI